MTKLRCRGEGGGGQGTGLGPRPPMWSNLVAAPSPPLSAAEFAAAAAAPVPAARNSRALCTASRRCQIASWTLKLAHAWVLGGVRLKYGLSMVPRGGGGATGID